MSTNGLQQMETFYMALADKTRLRLLNLMREDEICVCFFTEVLGESQPKISRHLAYLRAAGLVEARRDGKWMHYSIKPPNDEYGNHVLSAVLRWLESREDMKKDREKYNLVYRSSEVPAQIAKPQMPFIYEHPDMFEEEITTTHPGHNELEEFLL